MKMGSQNTNRQPPTETDTGMSVSGSVNIANGQGDFGDDGGGGGSTFGSDTR